MEMLRTDPRLRASPQYLADKVRRVSALEEDAAQWRPHWQELSNYILPQRYRALLDSADVGRRRARNEYIIDNTGTVAARTLASGLLNAVTSPTRQWFRLGVYGDYDKQVHNVRLWLDEVQRRMETVFAQSNFYNSAMTMYTDLTTFANAALLIYDDDDTVIRAYNPPVGTYLIGQSDKHIVDTFARKLSLTATQMIAKFGPTAPYSPQVLAAAGITGQRHDKPFQVWHLIEPNVPDGRVPAIFQYRECYWEEGAASPAGSEATFLSVGGFYEWPGPMPRWSVNAGETWGWGVGSEALGDIMALQHHQKRLAQAMDKLVNPPLQAPDTLKNRPMALMPNGVTYTSGLSGMEVKPLYQINPPVGEMLLTIQALQERIRETFYNPLFNMFSQMDKVRSATEIEARKDEKLVLLGGILERLDNEVLDPIIRRVYGICSRAGLFPPAPPELQGMQIRVQYVSILAVAQRAVGTAPIERFLQLTGQLAAVYPEVLDYPDVEAMLRLYAENTGVPTIGMKSEERVAQERAQREQQAASQQALEAGNSLSFSAANLAKADVGGGDTVLKRLING